MLSTGFNVVGFNWVASPAATELEMIVMDWLGEMLELPKSFLFSGNGGGVLQGTTCEAVLCTLVAARDQMLSRIGRENLVKLVVYVSDQTHSALQKAAQIAGIHPKNIKAIKTSKSTSFALSPSSLRAQICADIEAGLVPLFLCATVGTTSTTAVDPLGSLCDVAKDYGMWVHVDAAYAGSACICPEFRHFMDGVEGVNSISLNAHKWNKATDSKQVVDYKDWQITLSRRFRALKLWILGSTVGILSEERSNELNRKLLESINMSGHVYMTHTVVEGVYAIRFAVGATLVEERHIIMAWKVVQEHANVILNTYKVMGNDSLTPCSLFVSPKSFSSSIDFLLLLSFVLMKPWIELSFSPFNSLSLEGLSSIEVLFIQSSLLMKSCLG
uniref:Tyrosine decarboxylase n=1 Tax=Fagus sylvatica TaxID=28930 RepID=A0A2N9FWM7_FAGSY